MPKELTHILIAQDVVKQLKRSGQQLLAQVIKENLSAFYLGAIIPDAFFYDLIPFCKIPRNSAQIVRTLHSKESLENDQKAVSFFDYIGANPHVWPLTLAFATGIVTHTVSDRIIHRVIDHYTTTWGQEGSLAIASHRQIETLIDMVLLQQSRQHPRNFKLERRTALDWPTRDSLFRFYLGHLIGDSSTLPVCLLKALKRAYAQQLLFLKLFTVEPLYHIMNLSNKRVASCLQAWSTLFYPDTVGTQSFPILHKLDLNALTDGRSFTGTLASLVDKVITEAIRQINVGVRRLAT
jgi:hypothetical protein